MDVFLFRFIRCGWFRYFMFFFLVSDVFLFFLKAFVFLRSFLVVGVGVVFSVLFAWFLGDVGEFSCGRKDLDVYEVGFGFYCFVFVLLG